MFRQHVTDILFVFVVAVIIAAAILGENVEFDLPFVVLAVTAVVLLGLAVRAAWSVSESKPAILFERQNDL
jgi:4-amino-4-deoxy-L-arabinose transferase-like glycosyltransferase